MGVSQGSEVGDCPEVGVREQSKSLGVWVWSWGRDREAGAAAP